MAFFRDRSVPVVSSAMSFTVHPPERRRRQSVVVASGCCCSCCCSCCLHSLGGLVGAAMASGTGSVAAASVSGLTESDIDAVAVAARAREIERAKSRGVQIYWMSTLLTSMATLFLPALSNGSLAIGAIYLVLGMPAVQLAGFFLAATFVFFSKSTDKDVVIEKLVAITGGMIVGSMLTAAPLALFLL